MSNVYYVYIHRRASDNEVFYVGKGKGDRANSKGKRSDWWKKVVAKHGLIVEYVEKELSEVDAFSLEIELIRFYRENGHILCNMTDGGDGASGMIHTPETKMLMAEKKHKKVLCSNGMIFDSCKAAEKWIGTCPKSTKVSGCCRRKSRFSHGFVWRFLDDCDDMVELINSGIDPYTYFGGSHWEKNYSGIPKIVYCSNGLVFSSVSDAAHYFNPANKRNATKKISDCCCGRQKSTMGFRFSFTDDFNSGTENQISNPEKLPECGRILEKDIRRPLSPVDLATEEI